MAKPNFILGETYHDNNGPYLVTGFDGTTISYKYIAGAHADDKERTGNAEIKWRIECNLRRGPTPLFSSSGSSASSDGAGFFTHAEAFPIVANVIETYSQTHADFMVHETIIEALLKTPEAQRIAARRPDRTPRWCAGQMVAWFSKVFTDGRSDWEGRFERKRISAKWAYRVRRGKA
jgi:hypothetical protein